MNVHSLSNRSLQLSGSSRRQDSKPADSLISFKIPHLTPILPDEMLASIDAVLDDLLAGKITRVEAAMRIQGMMSREKTHL